MRELTEDERQMVAGGGRATNSAAQGAVTASSVIGDISTAVVGGAVAVATGGNMAAGLAAGVGLSLTGLDAAIGQTIAAAITGGNADATCSTSCTAANADACGAGGGGGAKVICTELCRAGLIDRDVWIADLRYSQRNFSDRTMRGYHLWGIPFVRLMRKHSLVRIAVTAPTRWFAEDIAYRMGVRTNPNLKGWIVREIFFRPLCSAIGIFAISRNWDELWTEK